MWPASQDAPQPSSSAKSCAPRASARSRSSSTSTAPPSPMFSPARPVRNGRHGSGSTERSELKPPWVSWQKQSAPPTTATSTAPSRSASSAAPSASVAEAQAEENVSTGPSTANWRATASPGALHCCGANGPTENGARVSPASAAYCRSASKKPPVLLPKYSPARAPARERPRPASASASRAAASPKRSASETRRSSASAETTS